MTSSTQCSARYRFDQLLVPSDLRAGLKADARVGLAATQKWLPPKYFCDDRGSALFE